VIVAYGRTRGGLRGDVRIVEDEPTAIVGSCADMKALARKAVPAAFVGDRLIVALVASIVGTACGVQASLVQGIRSDDRRRSQQTPIEGDGAR